MRFFLLLFITCLSVGLARVTSLRSQGDLLFVRQDASTVSTSFAPSSSSIVSSITTTSASSAARVTSSATTTISTISLSSTSSIFTNITTTHLSAAPIATTSPTASPLPDPDVLPIKPRISPAVGLAGAILLIVGVVLCFIGIKHAWLHIFLSVALLTSLAVTILVVYVMSPPVPDAIQGAYFVGAFATGVILGGLSLIFPEVTEGLSCLLGGFCVSMWLLTLRRGGTIENQVGRGIFIGVFCAIGWASSFVRPVRSHALIFCTAFSGATATILGIDCFTRAGLKEFWIYIWNLNNNEFPINTTTYPFAQGIRVEVACIVLLALAGLLTQLKIWKVVSKRRERRKHRDDRDKESWNRVEDLVGRRLQRNTEHSLKQWESVYGSDATPRDSAAPSVRSSRLVPGVREENTKAMDRGSVTFKQSRRISRLATDSSTTLAPSPSSEHYPTRYIDTIHESKTMESSITRTGSRGSSQTAIPLYEMEKSTEHLVPMKRMSNVPDVPPLPFKIPSRPASRVVSAIRSSISDLQRSVSPRPEDTRSASISRNGTPQPGRPSVSSEDDDLVSSVAATADDVADVNDLAEHRLSRLSAPVTASDGNGGSTPNRGSFVEIPVEEQDEEVVAREQKEVSKSTHLLPPDHVEVQRDPVVDHGPSLELREANLDDRGNKKVSRVATTFRTNEWAKHITEAEVPQDEHVRCESPVIQVDTSSHVAAITNADDPVSLSSTARQQPKSISNKPSPSYDEIHGSSTVGVRQPGSIIVERPNSRHFDGRMDSMAQTGLSRRSSGNYTPRAELNVAATASLTTRPVMSRSVSSKTSLRDYGQPQAINYGASVSNWPSTIGPTTIASKRGSLNQSRPNSRPQSAIHSTESILLANLPSTVKAERRRSRDSMYQQGDTSLSTKAERRRSRDSMYQQGDASSTTKVERRRSRDSMYQQGTIPSTTKAERRRSRESLYQQTNSRPTSAHRPSSAVRSTSARRPTTPGRNSMIYDSHQPVRGRSIDADRQAHIQAQWRQSLQQGSGQDFPQALMFDAAHLAMLNEQRQVEWHRQREQAEKAGRQSAIDMAMRSGQMHEAHRDALRRMQAGAKQDSPK